MGLASVRRSRVRPCCTWQRDVGGPFISFNTLAGRRPALRRLRRPPKTPTQSAAPVSAVFPADGNLHRLETRLQAIQPSPYHAGPPGQPCKGHETAGERTADLPTLRTDTSACRSTDVVGVFPNLEALLRLALSIHAVREIGT